MQKIFNWSKFTGIAGTILLLGAIGAPFIANDISQDNANSIGDIATRMETLETQIADGVAVDVTIDEGTLTQDIYDKLFEKDAYEALGETLALDEIDSRDFKKAVQSAINTELEGDEIESYKDIDKIVVKDITTTINDENVNVNLDLKVYYHVDGDEDEEGKARISTTIIVDDAANDDEENREDAEVDEDYIIDVDKIYD